MCGFFFCLSQRFNHTCFVSIIISFLSRFLRIFLKYGKSLWFAFGANLVWSHIHRCFILTTLAIGLNWSPKNYKIWEEIVQWTNHSLLRMFTGIPNGLYIKIFQLDKLNWSDIFKITNQFNWFDSKILTSFRHPIWFCVIFKINQMNFNRSFQM